MKRYRLSRIAESDLDRAWLQVAENAGPDAADHLMDEIEQCFRLLTRYPKAGRLRTEIGTGVRSFPIQNYVIYYSEQPRQIRIARILHGSRDQLSSFYTPF